MSPRGLWIASLLAAGLSGCGSDRAPALAVRRDSAGVELIEHRDVVSNSRVHLQATPVLDLGGTDGSPENELDPRQPWLGAVRLGDRSIVVNEFASLKFFTPDGKWVRTVGRAGSGPAEFSQIREMCVLAGDSLLVIDYSTGRLSVWAHDGTHVRTYPRPGYVPLRACAPDGTVIVRDPAQGVSAQPNGDRFVATRLQRIDGTPVRPLGLLPADAYFGPVIREAVSIPYLNGFLTADAREFEFAILGSSAKLRRRVRVLTPPHVIDDEEWRSIAMSTVPLNATRAERDRQLASFSTVPRPKAYPAFRRVHVDPDGRIWVEDYKDWRKLTVFDSIGSMLGTVVLPLAPGARAELVRAERDELIVLHRDALGAPHLRFLPYSISQR